MKFCGACGVAVDAPQTAAATSTVAQAQPFLISPVKLVLLSTLTFSLYDLYWFVKQWRYVKALEGGKIRPFWRGFFSVFFVGSLFRKLGLKRPIFWAVAYVALAFASRLPDNWWMLTFLAVLPLAQAQHELNVRFGTIRPGYSRKEIAAMVAGGLFWLLFLWLLTVT